MKVTLNLRKLVRIFRVKDGIPYIYPASDSITEIEWLLSFDFSRALTILKKRLADPLPDGYYFINYHANTINFLLTDDINEALRKLKAVGVIE